MEDGQAQVQAFSFRYVAGKMSICCSEGITPDETRRY